MMEYNPEEAEAVVSKNLKTTQDNMDEVVENILALRAQTTVVEASMSRLHNFGVHLRAQQAA